MKSYLNILFLFSICFCTSHIAAKENLLSGFQPALLEGDTTIMQQTGLQILTDCAGVILDPGGYGEYPNDVSSVITIQPPSPANVSLFFSQFHIENFFDSFNIYDGADQTAPLIGIYDNMELLGQTIVSSGGALTLVFNSDFTVEEAGFVIDYSVGGGSDSPVANFEISQTTPIPLNFPVSFSDLSTNAGSWFYDFGDGIQSTEQNPTHSFSTPGTYEVSLTISNCSNTNTYTQTVIVQESGQLEINPTETCVTLNSFMTTTVQVALNNTGVGDLYYNFTEISEENPNSLTVILGTGIIPPGGTQNVNLFFSAGDLLGGTYEFDLLLETGDANQPVLIYPVKMIVVGIPLITVSPNFVFFPEVFLGNPLVDSVCVTNLGTDTLHVTDIVIDASGFSLSPTELSVPPGGEAKFYITLLAESLGTFESTISILSNAGTVTIIVAGEVTDPPIGNFGPDDICLNLAQDESTLFIMGITNEGGESLEWTFDFLNTIPYWLEIGNLNGSLAPDDTESVPIIINATGLLSGTYEYTATISTNDPINGNAYLNVKLNVVAPPLADFFPTSQNTCTGVIEFIDTSLGGATSWLWDFGDGNISEEQNPIHTYIATGIYDISLIACNPVGCDTLVIENLINYTEGQSFCDTLIMGIVGDTTIYNCNGYIYDSGGPNEDYAENSNYTVTINPPDATSIYLVFDEFELESGNWDFLNVYAGEDNTAPFLGMYSGTEAPGGGDLLVSGESVTLEFISDGIIEMSGFGISYACTLPAAIAFFDANRNDVCSNEFSFVNNSLDATTYFWDFGDGNTSDEISPTHVYETTGSYFASLTAENSSGASTFTEVLEITSLPFDLNINPPTNIYLNNPTEFSYDCSVDLSEVEWTSHTGSTTSLDNPNFIFFQLGETEISLTGIDMNGCQVTTNTAFTVYETTQTSDDQQISSFKVYPNPNQGIVNLDLTLKENAQIEWTLFNTFGQTLLHQGFQSSSSINEILDLRHLPTGIYYLGIWLEGEFAGRRRIVMVDKD